MSSRIGRPRAERVNPIGRAFLKADLIKQCSTLVRFYKEFFEDASDLKYQGYKQPQDQQTIESAFIKFFRGERPLPEWYWIVLNDSFSITREELPTENTAEALAQRSLTTTDASANKRPAAPVDRRSLNKLPSGNESNQINLNESRELTVPRQGRSLADWFGELSSTEILCYIKTIHFAPPKQIDLICDELRDPQCLNVMAEKFVSGPVDDFTRLYFEYGDALVETLRGVVAAINSNSKLSDEHFKKVAQADFADLNLWFLYVADFFGEFACVQASNVENCFIDFAATPNFRLTHKNDDLETICYAVEGFAKFDCSRAIKVLTDFCFEDGGRLLKTAKPNIVGEFAALIGRDVFRERLEKYVDSSSAAKLIQCVNKPTHKRGQRK